MRSLQHSLQNSVMIKTLYECCGWSADEPILCDEGVLVKLHVNSELTFNCPHCGSPLCLHTKKVINVLDLPTCGRTTILETEVPQGYCVGCKKHHTLRPSTFHPRMGYTLRLMREISDCMIHSPASLLAKKYAISEKTIRRIDCAVLEMDTPPSTRDNLDAILIDEKYLGSKLGFISTIINASTGEPLYMARGRNGDCLRPFFESLTPKQKKSIVLLGIDRSNAYRAITLEYLPHLKVCFDAFHLVSNMNKVVDDTRRSLSRKRDEALKKRVTGMRYILLKAPDKLDQDGKRRLQELPCCNMPLYKVYTMREQFRAVFKQDSENGALLSLMRWIAMAVQSKVKPLINFARGISSCFNEVINGIRYKINSAKIESFNAGIKRIQSKCCGIYNIDYLFLKTRQIFFLRLQRN